MSGYPVLLHTAIDAQDCRGLAEFYRQLLGLHYREGEEPPTDGTPDDADWLVLFDDGGNRVVTVQQKKNTTPPTWPSEQVPMQMHMDFKVPTVEELERHRTTLRAWALGCCTTGHRTRENRSTFSRTRQDIPSVCSSSSAGDTHSHAALRASRGASNRRLRRRSFTGSADVRAYS